MASSTSANAPGLSCFKTYDVRGHSGVNLDESIALRIGAATVRALQARRLAIGGDARLSTPMLKSALARGITAAGCDVIDLGLTGTEEIYFASINLDIDGGIEVTASHNPADHNGFKFVGRNGIPLTDEEFARVRTLASANRDVMPSPAAGQTKTTSLLADYVDFLMSQVDLAAIRPTRLLADVGNGAAGHVIEEIQRRFTTAKVPVSFVTINAEPDGSFPNGVPNPLLPAKRQHTIDAMRRHGADIGIAWDGDFDRCFFYDEDCTYVSGYYIAGLLMAHFMQRHEAKRFVIDSRLNWNSLDILRAVGATGIPARTGHRFFKEVMRREDAIYGGEVSAHHYFRSFACCDSGMLPWLLVLEHLGRNGTTLSKAVAARKALYPSSEEINFEVKDPKAVVAALTEQFRSRAMSLDFTDGVTIELPGARINLRASNTEHLLRLNVETKGDAGLLQNTVNELSRLILIREIES